MGFSEIGLIFVVALVVLGPKKMPQLVAQVGRWAGRARAMARQFREQLENEINLEELTKVQPKPYTPPPAEPAATSPEPVTPTAEPPVSTGMTHGAEVAAPVADETPVVPEVTHAADIGAPATATSPPDVGEQHNTIHAAQPEAAPNSTPVDTTHGRGA